MGLAVCVAFLLKFEPSYYECDLFPKVGTFLLLTELCVFVVFMGMKLFA